MNAERLLAHYDRIADVPDAVPRLRRFILDLAVRGKLVEQDPNDEPASELLKRIARERARLEAAKKIRKAAELAKFEGEEISFDLQAEWLWARFGLIADFSAGRTPARNEPSYWEPGVHPWVSIADIRDGGTLNVTKESVSKTAAEHVFKARPCEVGTIIMSFKLTIGKIARLGTPAFHNEAIVSIRPHLPDLDPWLFLTLPFLARQVTAKNAIKGATLNRTSISNIPIPLPPLAEQHRIVAKVDELMALCDRLEAARTEREATRDRLAAAALARLNAPDPDLAVFRQHAAAVLDNLTPLTTRSDQIKALRQSILNLAVRGRLVEQDPDDEPVSELLARRRISVPRAGPFEIPAGWSWVNVGSVASARLGKMLDKGKNRGTLRRYLRNINVRWFDFELSDVLRMRFEDSELAEFALESGDVMICEGGEPGRAAVWDGREDDIYFQKAIHRVRFLNFVDGHFFAKALRASADDGRLAEYFTGTGIKHFTGKGLSGYLFPLPPLAEQHRIMARVDELMVTCDRLEASIAARDDACRGVLYGFLKEALEPAASQRGHQRVAFAV